jgi:hypothetical protein
MLTAPDYISEDLAGLAIPIENLTLLPGNYRKHDVPKIKRSLTEYKQRRPVVAQKTGEDVHGFRVGVVTAGNGTLIAAKELGWTHIAAVFEEDDDETALAWAIIDNRTHDLGSDDPELLLAALRRLEHNEALLASSGYNQTDLLALADSVIPKRPEAVEDGEEESGGDGGAPLRQPGNPVIQYQLIFDNEEQQQIWFKWVRGLLTFSTES